MKGEGRRSVSYRHWTSSEEARLRALYPDTPMHHMVVIFERTDRQIYQKARSLGLRRSAEYLASPASGRMLPGSTRGGATRFRPGLVPWNKGLKGWQAGGRARQTQFKPGRLPHNHNPVGHERITRDGYLERKVTDTGVTRRDYVAVHRLVWEQHHGPIPPGHVVVFRDAAPKHINITIDRLELIDRAELARRNTIHRYPPEVKAVIKKVARAKRKLQEKLKDEKPD